MQNSAQTQKPAAGGRHEGQAEAIARMQRAILRLALAYLGQNKDLDAKLRELGQLIRSGRRQRSGSLGCARSLSGKPPWQIEQRCGASN